MDHDWEADPRGLAECIQAWRAQHGWTVPQAAEQLGENATALKNWLAGREPKNSRPQRKLMTLIDRAKS